MNNNTPLVLEGVVTENEYYRIDLLPPNDMGYNYGILNKLTDRYDYKAPNLQQALGGLDAFTTSLKGILQTTTMLPAAENVQ